MEIVSNDWHQENQNPYTIRGELVTLPGPALFTKPLKPQQPALLLRAASKPSEKHFIHPPSETGRICGECGTGLASSYGA